MIFVAWTVGEQARPSIDLAALFDAHGPFLVRALRRFVPSDADVDDIVQDVFLIANQKRDVLDGSGNMRAWLYRTAKHVLRHRGRSFTRREHLARRAREEAPLVDDGSTDALRIEARRDVLAVRAAVASLPESLREVFVLFELEGLKAREIAVLVGTSEAAVYTRLTRARTRFRTLFDEETQRGGRHGGAHGEARAMA